MTDISIRLLFLVQFMITTALSCSDNSGLYRQRHSLAVYRKRNVGEITVYNLCGFRFKISHLWIIDTTKHACVWIRCQNFASLCIW